MPLSNYFLYPVPMQIFLSVASLDSFTEQRTISLILFFLSAFLNVSPQCAPFPIYLLYPLESVIPPPTFRLVIFLLFISQDFTVPSFSSPQLPSWWEFHPLSEGEIKILKKIKKQVCRLCQEPFLQRPFGGLCCHTELKLGPFSSSWFYLKEKNKKTKPELLREVSQVKLKSQKARKGGSFLKHKLL